MINFFTRIRRPRDLLLLFEILAFILLFFYNDSHIDIYITILFVGLILIIYISNFLLGKISKGDNYIFMIVSMLLSLGLITVYRINPHLGFLQLVWILLGLLSFYICYFALRAFRKLEDYSRIYALGIFILLISTLIFAVIFKTGRQYGSYNWIRIGSFSVQPSEFAKILMMFLLASYFTKYRYKTDIVNKNKPAYNLLFITYFFIAILFIERDLGMSVVFLSLYLVTVYIYENDRKILLINFILIIIGSIVGYMKFDHVKVRVSIWINPWNDPYRYGAQIVQSLFAIAEGDFFGKGIGRGFPNLVPVRESDSIFPFICEEMGIFIGIAIIMMFMLLAYRGYKIALSQEYLFYRILAICVSTLFAIQAFLNIGGVVKFIPMTGITLPFVSYGGSSMLSSFICLAILQVCSEDMSYKYEWGSMFKDNKRILVVLVLVIVLYLSLILYLSYFTVFVGQNIIDNPANRRETIIEQNIERGSILDREGNILSYSEGEKSKAIRKYNYPISYSHIIGYSDKVMGKAGIEKSYDKYLLGLEVPRSIKVLKSVYNKKVELDKGNNVYLTTNTDIQNYSREILSKTGAAGAIVAMDPKTGDILAMVSLPDFNSESIAKDNKALSEQNKGALYNRAIWTKYPPGSTFKIITAASLLENKIDQNYVDEGSQEIDGRVFKNALEKTYGALDLKSAFVNSVNTYFVKKTVDLGAESLGKTTDRFMFNSNFDFDLPYHASIFKYNNISKTELASSGIGHGTVSATPLEMCMVTASIANDGKLMQPNLVGSVISPKGEVILKKEPQVLSEAVTPEIAAEIKDYMLAVVGSGSGRNAYRRGYGIAGKTGTAQKSQEGQENFAWFVGFAPAKDPKIAIAVVLEDVNDYGGSIAAPIAGDIMKYAIDLGI